MVSILHSLYYINWYEWGGGGQQIELKRFNFEQQRSLMNQINFQKRSCSSICMEYIYIWTCSHTQSLHSSFRASETTVPNG
jgi:hypothetical protein